MKIQKECYEHIKQYLADNSIHSEVGGILGGNDSLITSVFFDAGYKGTPSCCYAPDVKKLNRIIAEWIDNDIQFLGIFHTHFGGLGLLSRDDKMYIDKIMRNMPTCIESLYFPIVTVPDIEIQGYLARINKSSDDLVVEPCIVEII